MLPGRNPGATLAFFMGSIAGHFTSLDWSILIGYLVLTTVIGHFLGGKQATIRDFFLAGRSIPWPAVCGSIIATEISALTFIGVPGMVFAATGDLTYLQWGIGSFVARILVGLFFVPAFYEKEIFSPYEFMGNRLQAGIKQLASTYFFIGSILGQAVRLLVTALILRTVTGLNFEVCICVIAAVAVLWTLMGGMTTVIWTDVIQFGVFIFGGLFAFVLLVLKIDGGWAEIWQISDQAGKLRLIDLTFDPAVQFTLWTGILAMPFQNMAAFGTDQLNAQRMFCCRSAADARKAIIWSGVSMLITVLMLAVGLGLYVYYQQNPPNAAALALFKEDGDNVFPVWITTVIPPGFTGLIMAGAFAAAISSLDSLLAALSQTTLALFRGAGADPRAVTWSRWLVVFWGIVLAAFAIQLNQMREGINMVSLAFGMVAYTYGPLLGILFMALAPRGKDGRGLWVGAFLSLLLALWVRPELYNALIGLKIITPELKTAWQPGINFAWLYPATCLLTLACGHLFGKKVAER